MQRIKWKNQGASGIGDRHGPLPIHVAHYKGVRITKARKAGTKCSIRYTAINISLGRSFDRLGELLAAIDAYEGARGPR